MKKRVFLWACSVWVIRCTTLLCLAILRFLILGIGVRMLIGGGVMCPCHYMSTMCSWDFDV